MTSHRQTFLKPPHKTGFTLIELLTVIVILAVLGAIIIPTVGKARSMAANAQCITALRQWGMGIQMYVNENRNLPGPLYGHVLPVTRTNKGQAANGHLFSFIAPYSSLQTSYTNRAVPDDFLCRGWRAEVSEDDWDDTPAYILNMRTKIRHSNGNIYNSSPWGNAAASEEDPRPAYRYAEIIDLNDATETWAIRDLDAMNTSATSTAHKLPPKPVHGTHRNQLYFDWHVGQVDVEESNN